MNLQLVISKRFQLTTTKSAIGGNWSIPFETSEHPDPLLTECLNEKQRHNRVDHFRHTK